MDEINPAFKIFLASLSAIPLVWSLNKLAVMGDQRVIFAAGVIVLSSFALISYYAIRNTSKYIRQEPLFYVWSVFAFTACVDLMVGLEVFGFVSGFMTFYLRQGEPYLDTAHGGSINMWDGTGQYFMYIYLLWWFCDFKDFSQCRLFGLYWVGSIGNSMFPLLIGGATGTFKVKWSYFLNVPYVVFPIYAGIRFMSLRKEEGSRQRIYYQPSSSLSIFKRPMDLMFVVYLVAALCFTLFRGLVSLGSDSVLTQSYLKNFEPYLKDPNMFSHIQMLVYLFYFCPYYVAAIYGLLTPGQGWLTDWTFLFAGASLQGQIVHIASSLCSMTKPEFRVPSNPTSQAVFWIVNLALLVVPTLFAARCYRCPAFFQTKAVADKASASSESPITPGRRITRSMNKRD